MYIPPIDLSPLLKILKKEGHSELMEATNIPGINPFHGIITEWNYIIRVLEGELIPQLAKGGDLTNLSAAARPLKESALSLSRTATQFLSFVPGPIGIVCSIISAIVCFSSGQIANGIFELFGCIPGGKLGVKGASKIMSKMEDLITSLIINNAKLFEALVKSNPSKLIDNNINVEVIIKLKEKILKRMDDIQRYTQDPIHKLYYNS
ncbi:MAG: hypothetical protein J6V55_02320 [Alistipes sp.]|nr:hypothetical protein [Alistipes sp.]